MPRHIHILGICGTFMGGIAAIAAAAGYRVTGCDANVYPPMSDQLRSLGIELLDGFSAEQIAINPDLWIVGNVVTRGNPLMEAILDRGLPFQSGPQWLSENALFRKWVLAVSGTHGKTTTASMLAWVLDRSGLAPGFLIGGVPLDFGTSARIGTGPHFVIEADEYDTAFFDKRSKFLHYRAKTAVINNIEFDHADIFDDLASIERQFHQFVRTLPSTARIVANGLDAAIERVLSKGCWSEREMFGSPEAWAARPLADDEFEVLHADSVLGRLRWGLLGEHNRMNALAAIAAANHAGVSPSRAIAALSEFKGVKRRMEIRGRQAEVTVYDDFAHHPTAIETTLAGLRAKVGAARILAVLEPRSNTMKLGVMKGRLAESLRNADRVFVSSAGLGWDPAAPLASLGERVRVADSIACLVRSIAAEARAGDHVLVMSNGGFDGIHGRILDALAARISGPDSITQAAESRVDPASDSSTVPR